MSCLGLSKLHRLSPAKIATSHSPRAVRRSGIPARPITRGQQAAVFQWQPGISLAGVRLDKSGSGESPAAVWLLCRRGQSNPRRSAEYPKQSERLKTSRSEEPSSEKSPAAGVRRQNPPPAAAGNKRKRKEFPMTEAAKTVLTAYEVRKSKKKRKPSGHTFVRSWRSWATPPGWSRAASW